MALVVHLVPSFHFYIVQAPKPHYVCWPVNAGCIKTLCQLLKTLCWLHRLMIRSVMYVLGFVLCLSLVSCLVITVLVFGLTEWLLALNVKYLALDFTLWCLLIRLGLLLCRWCRPKLTELRWLQVENSCAIKGLYSVVANVVLNC